MPEPYEILRFNADTRTRKRLMFEDVLAFRKPAWRIPVGAPWDEDGEGLRQPVQLEASQERIPL